MFSGSFFQPRFTGRSLCRSSFIQSVYRRSVYTTQSSSNFIIGVEQLSGACWMHRSSTMFNATRNDATTTQRRVRRAGESTESVELSCSSALHARGIVGTSNAFGLHCDVTTLSVASSLQWGLTFTQTITFMGVAISVVQRLRVALARAPLRSSLNEHASMPTIPFR